MKQTKHATAALGGDRGAVGGGMFPFGAVGDPTLMNCGVLMKKGSRNRQWKKRYFWLCAERKLIFYFKCPKSGNQVTVVTEAINRARPAQQDCVPLEGCTVHEGVRDDGLHHAFPDQIAHAFSITSSAGREYQFVALGDDAKAVSAAWAAAIRRVGRIGAPPQARLAALQQAYPLQAAAPLSPQKVRPPPRAPPPRDGGIDAAQCAGYAAGSGGTEQAAAGAVAFDVLLRSRSGAPVPPAAPGAASLIRATLDGVAIIPLERASGGGAMHRLVLDLSRAGSHALDVRVAQTNAAVAGSPFVFNVKAAAPVARCSQLLLRAGSMRFELVLRDAFGNASPLGVAQQLSVTALPSPPYHLVSVEARPGLVGVYTGAVRTDVIMMAAEEPPTVQMQASIDGQAIPCIVAASALERTREQQAHAQVQGASEEEKLVDAVAPSAAAPPSPAALPPAVVPQRSPPQQRHVLRPIFDGYAPFSLDAMRAFARDFTLIDAFLTSEQVEWAFLGAAKASSALSFEQWLVAVEVLAMAKFPGDSRATALLVERELIPRARRLA